MRDRLPNAIREAERRGVLRTEPRRGGVVLSLPDRHAAAVVDASGWRLPDGTHGTTWFALARALGLGMDTAVLCIAPESPDLGVRGSAIPPDRADADWRHL